MRPALTLLAVTLTLTSTLVNGQEASFVDSDPATHFKNRNLLQDAAENDLAGDGGSNAEAAPEASKYTTEIQEGPELFYDGKDFLMKVGKQEKEREMKIETVKIYVSHIRHWYSSGQKFVQYLFLLITIGYCHFLVHFIAFLNMVF